MTLEELRNALEDGAVDCLDDSEVVIRDGLIIIIDSLTGEEVVVEVSDEAEGG